MVHSPVGAGADGRCEALLKATSSCSALSAAPGLSSAASEPHFSSEETPQNIMLLLPAAALCCLCSALVSTATQLTQEDLTLTRRVGDKVSFTCGGISQCGDYVLWYQKKDSETFRAILDIDRNSGALDKSYNHPQKADFSAVNTENGCELQIQNVSVSHAASYFCSCWVPTLMNEVMRLNKNQQRSRCHSESETGREQRTTD